MGRMHDLARAALTVTPTGGGIVSSQPVSREARVRLTEDQVAVLNELVREMRPQLLDNGIDVRFWGLSDDGSYFKIMYRGAVPPASELVEPFLRYGPETVKFVPGDVSMLPYEDPAS